MECAAVVSSHDFILTFFDILLVSLCVQAGHELIFLCESDPGARQVWIFIIHTC